MKCNPFEGVQAADWALMAGVEASARHANARRACFRCDLLGGVYISGQAPRPRRTIATIRGYQAPRAAARVGRFSDVWTRYAVRPGSHNTFDGSD
jgi:hypothetical protein